MTNMVQKPFLREQVSYGFVQIRGVTPHNWHTPDYDTFATSLGLILRAKILVVI